MTELRVTEVNISQVKACHALLLGAFEHMGFSATRSFAINCQNVSESTCFRHEHTSSETKRRIPSTFIHQQKYWNQSLVAEEN